MKSKIYKVKRDLRALKKSSHALERLISIRGTHYTRIKLIESLPKSPENEMLLAKEKELISALDVAKLIKENEAIEEKYMGAISTLPSRDRAMVLDCYINGMPYWKIGLEYGYSEEGARKHVETIVKKIAAMQN